MKDSFFSKGCLFFTGAFSALEGQLLAQSVPKSQKKDDSSL